MLVGFSGLFAGVLLVLVDGGSWALGWCVCLVSIYSWGYAFVGGSCALVVGCVGGICLDSLVAGVIGMCSLLGWWWLWLCCTCSCLHVGLDVCAAAVICGGLRSLCVASLFRLPRFCGCLVFRCLCGFVLRAYCIHVYLRFVLFSPLCFGQANTQKVSVNVVGLAWESINGREQMFI